MSNNLICDPASIASNARRIEDHAAVVALGFGRLHLPGWPSNRFGRFGWRYRAWPWDGWTRWGGLLVDLPSRYIGPDEQTGIVCSERQLHTCAKAAITRGRFVVAFGIGEAILLPGQEDVLQLCSRAKGRGR